MSLARRNEEEAVKLCASIAALADAAGRKAQGGDAEGALRVLGQLDQRRNQARAKLQSALDISRGVG